jgi:hypothetical protein
MENAYTSDGVPGRYWHALADGRIQCDLCPRECKLHEGQRGLCFVRARTSDQIVLTTYGRSSGFCLDSIEKKPLNHFLPGTAVLSFGTAGCNLTCKFCQNWDISKARALDRLPHIGLRKNASRDAQVGCSDQGSMAAVMPRRSTPARTARCSHHHAERHQSDRAKSQACKAAVPARLRAREWTCPRAESQAAQNRNQGDARAAAARARQYEFRALVCAGAGGVSIDGPERQAQAQVASAKAKPQE